MDGRGDGDDLDGFGLAACGQREQQRQGGEGLLHVVSKAKTPPLGRGSLGSWCSAIDADGARDGDAEQGVSLDLQGQAVSRGQVVPELFRAHHVVFDLVDGAEGRYDGPSLIEADDLAFYAVDVHHIASQSRGLRLGSHRDGGHHGSSKCQPSHCWPLIWRLRR